MTIDLAPISQETDYLALLPETILYSMIKPLEVTNLGSDMKAKRKINNLF